MIIGAIDVPVPIGMSIAGLLLVLSAWYWHRLAGAQFQPSTRALRRGTLILAVLAIFALLRAASFVDSKESPDGYIMAWLSSLGLIFLTVLLLGVDVFNSFRIHRRIFIRETMESAALLRQEIHARRSAGETGDDPVAGAREARDEGRGDG